MPAADVSPTSPSRAYLPAWLTMLGIAVLLLLTMEFLDAWLALPLRELSAALASFLLNSLSFPVQRHGTILVADNFTWDVVPACSGSTSLRVLLTSAVIWCGIQPGLNGSRKLLCVLGAVPLALLANGVRVAVLTYLGTIYLRPVEGLLHNLIGVAALMLGMGAVILLTSVATPTGDRTSRRYPLQGGLLTVLLLLLYAPALAWMVAAWRHSPLDRSGPWYVLAAVGCLLMVLWKHASHSPQPRTGTCLFAGSLSLLVLATIVDVSLLKATALLLSWFAIVSYFRGLRVAGCCLPAFALCYLGLPTVTYQLNTLISTVLGPGWDILVGLLKVGLAALATLLSWLLVRRAGHTSEKQRTSSSVPSLQPLLYVAAAGLILQAYHFHSAASPRNRLGLELSHFQGNWNGANLPISPAAEQIIGRERIISRRYTNDDRWVELLVSSTGGDRRRAHAPEYCMTGSGWRIKERSALQLPLPIAPVDVTLMTLSREGSADRLFAYWFADGEGSWATFPGLLAEDAIRRLRGRITDWYVFRLIASDEADLRDFAENLRFDFQPAPSHSSPPEQR